MERYRKKQYGFRTIMIPGGILLGIFLFVALQIDQVGGLIALALALLVLYAFHALTVTVQDGLVKVSFVFPFLSRTINLADVERAAPARNSWIWGWGIRLIPNGWMFNIEGLDSVELVLKSGRTFRIGTKEPEALTKVILEEAEANGLQVES